MNDPVEVKGIILIIATLGGVAALWMGYDLFRRGIDRAADAEASMRGWTFRLIGVGPGVFFAVAGTAAIWFAATRNLQRDTHRQWPVSVAQSAAVDAAKNAQLASEAASVSASEAAKSSKSADRVYDAAMDIRSR